MKHVNHHFTFILFSLIFSFPLCVFSQEEAPLAADSISILNAQQLQAKVWVRSITEAQRDPENVYKLSLEDQKLGRFPFEVLNYPNLQALNLSGNKLTEIPEEISSLTKLETLILSRNKLRSLPVSMKDLPTLTYLYISKNKLTEIPAWFGGMAKVRVLDLSFNPVTHWEIQQLRQLLRRCEVMN
ncbi:MAG: leucine-rich repeat domain-containing protein [Bacteroidota bacterium]